MKVRGLILAILMLAMIRPAAAFLAADQIELTFDIALQTANVSSRFFCRDSAIVESFVKKEWWLAVASPAPAAGGSDMDLDSELTCDSGLPAKDDPVLPGTADYPWVTAGFTTVVRPVRKMEDERNLTVEVSVSLRKRIGQNNQASPEYQTTEIKRVFYFSDDAQAIIPLMVRNGQDQQQPGNFELFMRIAAHARPVRETSAYGTIIVSSDMAEAELFLDGGLAGAVTTGEETLLPNVAAGMRLLAARDASGREVRQAVRVLAKRTVLAHLRAADPQRSAGAFHLLPQGVNAQGFEEYRREIDGAVVIRVPAGEFLMGNKDTERAPLEHSVYVSDFLIDKTGVTWRQFKKFAAATGTPLPPAEPYWGFLDDHPAVYVPWVEAKTYCEWAGGRLPTEAEREKAARGTDGRKYPWGDVEPKPELGVFRKSWGHHSTAPVGTHPDGASPYGALDMGGNVWEWCSDWYDGDYYATSPYRNPRGPATGKTHVVRGGSWDSRPTVLSASCRSWGHLGYRDGDFGFRCAMNAPEVMPIQVKTR